jgi:hypothetical protein
VGVAEQVERRPVGADAARRTVVLGLLAAQGLTRELADRLAEVLPQRLSELFPEVAWRIEVREEPLAAASAPPDVDLVQIARRRLLDEGWDLAVCLTDLPVLVRRRPVTVHASVTHGVGLVSVPALGAVGLESRVEAAVVRLVDALLGDRLHRRRRGVHRRRARIRGRLHELSTPVGEPVREAQTIRFVTHVVRGNLRLLVGMVRANRPWRLIAGLSRALVAALGAGAFGMVSTGVWKVANGLPWWRLGALCASAIVVTSVALIVWHELWERSPSPAARERVVLFNLATTLTIVIGVLTMFAALLAISTVCVVALIARDVLSAEIGHPAGAASYVRIALVLSMLATLGGALGSALENHDAVHQAAYGYSPDE